MKWIVYLLLIFGLCGSFFWKTDGFSPKKIQMALVDCPDEPSSIAVPATFCYLGKGKQAFVFEHGDLVLKLFNADQLKKSWRFWLPFGKEKREAWWKEKVRIFHESYALAMRYLSQETGVLIAHLGRSERKFPVVAVIDGAGRRFQIDLNTVPFVLQKKGKRPFYEALQTAEESELKLLIDAYLAFQARRISLCIADHDRDMKHNYCWNEATLQYIDPARCFFEPRLQEQARRELEWWKATHRLRKWLLKRAPDLVSYFDTQLKESRNSEGGSRK